MAESGVWDATCGTYGWSIIKPSNTDPPPGPSHVPLLSQWEARVALRSQTSQATQTWSRKTFLLGRLLPADRCPRQ